MENDMLYILLADDDDDDRLFFKDAIEELNVKTSVVAVNDGVELMDYIQDSNSKMPNLLFLDLNMPRKGGIECLKEIRKDTKFKELNIIIYSTSSLKKDIDETFAAGANLYIKKPNDFEELKTILDKVIQLNWECRKTNLSKADFLFNI